MSNSPATHMSSTDTLQRVLNSKKPFALFLRKGSSDVVYSFYKEAIQEDKDKTPKLEYYSAQNSSKIHNYIAESLGFNVNPDTEGILMLTYDENKKAHKLIQMNLYVTKVKIVNLFNYVRSQIQE